MPSMTSSSSSSSDDEEHCAAVDEMLDHEAEEEQAADYAFPGHISASLHHQHRTLDYMVSNMLEWEWNSTFSMDITAVQNLYMVLVTRLVRDEQMAVV
eukprot:2152886-Rhodomonas_salina.2